MTCLCFHWNVWSTLAIVLVTSCGARSYKNYVCFYNTAVYMNTEVRIRGKKNFFKWKTAVWPLSNCTVSLWGAAEMFFKNASFRLCFEMPPSSPLLRILLSHTNRLHFLSSSSTTSIHLLSSSPSPAWYLHTQSPSTDLLIVPHSNHLSLASLPKDVTCDCHSWSCPSWSRPRRSSTILNLLLLGGLLKTKLFECCSMLWTFATWASL